MHLQRSTWIHRQLFSVHSQLKLRGQENLPCVCRYDDKSKTLELCGLRHQAVVGNGSVTVDRARKSWTHMESLKTELNVLTLTVGHKNMPECLTPWAPQLRLSISNNKLASLNRLAVGWKGAKELGVFTFLFRELSSYQGVCKDIKTNNMSHLLPIDPSRCVRPSGLPRMVDSLVRVHLP